MVMASLLPIRKKGGRSNEGNKKTFKKNQL